jgi:NADH-quinone oxidoreductase subunit J
MFLIFALITLIGALALSVQRNLVVAGLCLVVTFMGVAGLFLLLANPVAAALQIIVYSGAIVVLVLFVIMMLNSHQEEAAERPRLIQRGGAVAVTLLLGAGAVKLVVASPLLNKLGANSPMPQAMDLNRLGIALFSDHMVAFEVAGLLLLASMIGAVALVKRDL